MKATIGDKTGTFRIIKTSFYHSNIKAPVSGAFFVIVNFVLENVTKLQAILI